MFRSLARAGLASAAKHNGRRAAMNPVLQQARGFRASAVVDYQRAPEEPLGPSMVEKYQLDDPTRYVPLTVGTFGLATMTGLYHVDAETQLLALWVLYCGVVYSRGGPAIGEFLDEMSDQIAKEHEEVEALEIKAASEVLEAAKNVTVIHSDIKALFDAQKELTGELLAGAQNQYMHGMRAAFVKQLDALVANDKKFGEETNALLVKSATEAVKKAYLPGGDAALKDAALSAALSALSNPESAKRDPSVGKLYSKYLSDFSAKYAAEKGKEQKVDAETKAAMKEAMENVARREGIDVSQVEVPSTVALP